MIKFIDVFTLRPIHTFSDNVNGRLTNKKKTKTKTQSVGCPLIKVNPIAVEDVEAYKTDNSQSFTGNVP